MWMRKTKAIETGIILFINQKAAEINQTKVFDFSHLKNFDL